MNVLEIKAAVRARDGHCCTECGMSVADHLDAYGKDLDVHRTTPGSEYSLEPGVCVTLCRRCHGPKPRRPRASLLRRTFCVPHDLYIMAKHVAMSEGISLSKYFDRIIRQAVQDDWNKMMAEATSLPPHPGQE